MMNLQKKLVSRLKLALNLSWFVDQINIICGFMSNYFRNQQANWQNSSCVLRSLRWYTYMQPHQRLLSKTSDQLNEIEFLKQLLAQLMPNLRTLAFDILLNG